MPRPIVAPLQVAIRPLDESNIRYASDLENPRICVSPIIRRDRFGAPIAWLTGTILNHEYAHHLFFSATRFRSSLQAEWEPVSFTAGEISLIRRGEPPEDVFEVERTVALGARGGGDAPPPAAGPQTMQ